MKEKYSSPMIVNAEIAEGKEGAFPFVVAGVTAKAAMALLAGYAAGRAVSKAVKASPNFKLPSLKMFRGDENDFCMA